MLNALARLGKTAVLGIALLGFISIFSSPASAQGDEWVESDKGRSHIEYQRGSEFKQIIYGGPVFLQADNGDWVSYLFEELDDRYVIQHPHASVKFFDYYSTIWDENLQNVVIYDDRWTVEYLNKQGNWTDSSFWNIVRLYEVGDDWISIFRTGDTVIGKRVENYTFRRGSPVKIRIEQTADSAKTIRFSWRPSGIVAATEKTHKDDENRDSHLTYYDAENNWMGTLAWFDELEIVDSIDVTCETHAQGRKAAITFGSFEVGAGGTAVLDPTVSISPSADATIYLNLPNRNYGSFSYMFVGHKTTTRRLYISFDLRSIPNSASINSAALYLRQTYVSPACSGAHVYGVHRVNDAWSESIITWNNAPSFTAQETDNAIFDAYASDWRSWTVTSDIDSQAVVDNNWVSWCVTAENEAENNRTAFVSRDYTTTSTLHPYLEVSWSPTKPTAYDLKVEGQTSPQRLTTFTPEFSFIYVDNEGDNMENFRVQVGTSAGDNSLWDITTAQENENGDNVTITYAGTTLSRGTSYFWRVRVQDNNSDWGSFSENENFQINRVPTCSITAPPDGYNAEIDESIGFTSSASDPDGDTLTYHWDFGDLLGTSALANPSYPYTTSGDYTATLYVNDGYESSSTDSILVSVGGGAPPDGNGEDGNGNGNGAPSNGGGGGGAGGFVSDVAETVEDFVEEHIQPTKNVLFMPISFLFGIPLWVPMVGVAGGARAMKKKGKGIFWSVVLVFIFLTFYGFNL